MTGIPLQGLRKKWYHKTFICNTYANKNASKCTELSQTNCFIPLIRIRPIGGMWYGLTISCVFSRVDDCQAKTCAIK